MHTNSRLENGLMYSYQAFHFDVINAYTTYTKYKSWNKNALITRKIHFHFPLRNTLNVFSSMGYQF